MLDHISIPVSDLAASKAFFVQSLAPIGFGLLGESDRHAAFGFSHMPYLIVTLTDVSPAAVHVAFTADTRSQVDEFHALAIAAGGTDNGVPGLRTDYHPNYYGAFVLDPDGHNIEVVKHQPE
jgi:catechol 2,3-dioxygenase-like lactoylglutathione lyase family enzyme